MKIAKLVLGVMLGALIVGNASAETKIKATVSGDMAEVKMVMQHPMTVHATDAKTGVVTPAHHINVVKVFVNDSLVLQQQMAAGVSKNPFLAFKLKSVKAGDKVKVEWVDNQGVTDSSEGVVVAK